MVMKSSEFHGKDLYNVYICIGRPSHEICQISWPWNQADFMKFGRFHGMKYGGFHGKDLYICIGSDEKYSMKSGRFHAIWQISWPWNPADFMKFSKFHGKDLYICIGCDERYSILVVDHEIRWISWNLVDFMHEIWWISWNLVDFMKSGRFHHEIRQISWNLVDFMPRTLVLMKNTAFSGRPCNTVYLYWFWRKIHYPWNPADFMVKSGKFHEIQQISWWNLADFIHEIRRISWLILKNANLKM